MSSDHDPGNEQKPPPAPWPVPAEPKWNPVATTLMILLGFPLLLPGVCGFIFSAGGGTNVLAFAGILIAVGGIVMIIFGVRRLLVSAASSPPAVSETPKLVFLIILFVIVAIFAIGLLSILATVRGN